MVSSLRHEKAPQVWSETFDDGMWKERYEYYTTPFTRRRVKNGSYNSYHPNGECRCQGTYKEGEKEGNFLFYFETGRLRGRVTFRNGKLNGEGFKCYEDGKMAKGAFKEGVHDGRWIWYYNGLRVVQGNFKAGKIDGRWLWFFDNGEIGFESRFWDGKRDGRSVWYDRNGRPRRTADFEAGVCVNSSSGIVEENFRDLTALLADLWEVPPVRGFGRP